LYHDFVVHYIEKVEQRMANDKQLEPKMRADLTQQLIGLKNSLSSIGKPADQK
jgi:hypothetical protein